MTRLPEFPLILFSFLLHFVREFRQAPPCAGMIDLNHRGGIKLCSSATCGDVGFALTTFWGTSAAGRSRSWSQAPKAWQTLIVLGIGIALTVGFGHYYTDISLRRWCRRSAPG